MAVAIGGTALVAFSMLCVILAAPLGIDVTDQALYLTMVDQPNAAIRSASGYHFLLAPLFSLLGESIVSWRLLRAALDVGVDVLFGVALVHYLRARHPNMWLTSSRPVAAGVVSLVVGAGFAAWISAPNGFGYNELGSILITLLAASLLYELTNPRLDLWRLSTAFLAGATFGSLLITRWTAAVALGLGIASIVWMNNDKRGRCAIFGTAASGAILSMAVAHLFIVDAFELLQGIEDGTSDVSRGTHARGRIFTTYWNSLRFGVRDTPIFLVSLATLLGVLRLHRTRRISTVLTIGAFSAIVALTVLVDRASGTSRLFELNRWGVVLGLICMGLLAHQANQRFAGRVESHGLAHLAAAAVLSAAPLVAALGTNNPIFVNGVILAPLWVGAAIMMLHQQSLPSRARNVCIAAVLMLVATVPILVYESLLHSPKRIWGEQNIEVTNGRFAGLRVDATTHQFFEDLEDVRGQLKPNPTVLSFWKRPAATFALGGKGIGFPWYSEFALDAAGATMEGACTDGAIPQGQVVVVTEETNRAEFGPLAAALETCGILFPEQFRLVSKTIAPGEIAVEIYVRD